MRRFVQWANEENVMFTLNDRDTGVEVHRFVLGKKYHMLIIDALLVAWLVGRVVEKFL